MTSGPVLQTGEDILHHHVPSLGAFKRTALLLLAVTLVPTVVVVALFPDTFWGAIPMFVTCLILVQERYNLGKYAAWITNQRVVFQGDAAIELSDISEVDTVGNAVRMRPVVGGKNIKIYYPNDRTALVATIEKARTDASKQVPQ